MIIMQTSTVKCYVLFSTFTCNFQIFAIPISVTFISSIKNYIHLSLGAENKIGRVQNAKVNCRKRCHLCVLPKPHEMHHIVNCTRSAKWSLHLRPLSYPVRWKKVLIYSQTPVTEKIWSENNREYAVAVTS